MTPFVSIVTLYHNEPLDWLHECIASVHLQTYRDWEHVIVDIASDTPLLAGGGSWRIDKDLGIASSRNFGVQHSSGRYIVMLDADDKIHPEFLARLLPFAGRDKIVCPGLQEFGGRRGTAGIPDEGNCTLPTFLRHNPIYCCSMFSREDYDAAGGYDPHLDFIGCEDYEFWTHLVKRGAQVCIVPEVLFHYRVRGGSLTERNAAHAEAGHAYVRAKHG